jgi:hypothetical protein
MTFSSKGKVVEVLMIQSKRVWLKNGKTIELE